MNKLQQKPNRVEAYIIRDEIAEYGRVCEAKRDVCGEQSPGQKPNNQTNN